MSRFICPRCKQFAAPTFWPVFWHISREHEFEHNFVVQCGIKGCEATYTKMESWRKHIYRHHKNATNQGGGESTLEISDTNFQSDDTVSYDQDFPEQEYNSSEPPLPNLQRSSALFILKTRDGKQTTQTCLDNILADVTTLTHQNMQHVCHHALEALREAGGSDAMLSAVRSSILDRERHLLFKGMETEYLQNSLLRQEFGLLEPVERVLGREYVQKGSRTSLQSECCYDVPLLQSLQSLLDCQTIQQQIFESHQSQSDVISDYCDGKDYRNHDLFVRHPHSLQIIFYYDDVEMANPIGSSLHKLGLFYYSLANLEPRLHAPATAIQLVSVVKQTYIEKYGIDEIIRPFVEAVTKLEDGVQFVINGQPKLLRGTLIAVSADNLASQLIGGYKALNSAFRKCRQCMATNETMQAKFAHEDFEPRTVQLHERVCQSLETAVHGHVATTYGINRDSILNSLQHFHVVTGLPPDVMHDILEGSLKLEIKCLLCELIKRKKLFSLEELNTRIANFNYGSDASDHPPSCVNETILTSGKLKFSASETWSFARLLPILVGDLVPEDDPYWENFLLLLDITSVAMAPRITIPVVAYLHDQIAEHHSSFVQLYTEQPLIPKMHYMVHLPHFIQRYGPIRHFWCMRFEAKHQHFKHIAKVIGNFKNLAKSLAHRHQRHMCYVLADSSFLRDAMQCGPVINSPVSVLEFEEDMINSVPGVSSRSTIQRTKWVIVKGTKYRITDCVLLKYNRQVPVFGIIKDIVLRDDALFVVEPLDTVSFVKHYNAYQVSQTSVQTFVITRQDNLADHCPLGIYQPHNSTRSLITLKYYVLDELDLE